MAEKFALVIGCNEYQDSTLPRLKTPSGDIQDLAALIKNPEIGNFNNVVTLLNKPFSTVSLEIARLFANKNKDDLLLLYFSGHGVLDEQGRLYFAMQDTLRNLLSGSAISANFVLDEMNNSRSKRQLLILDCCHSGAFSRGTKSAIGQKVITNSTFKGDSYGRAVLTATDATQYAWEGNRIVGTIENSLFTHYLLDGLRTGNADLDGDGKITSDELYRYTHKRVTNSTEKQKPQFWVYGQEGEQITVAFAPMRHVEPSIATKKKRENLDIDEIAELLTKQNRDATIIIDLITKPFRKEFIDRINSSTDETVIHPVSRLAGLLTHAISALWSQLTGKTKYLLYLIFFIAMLTANTIVVYNTLVAMGISVELPVEWMKHYELTVFAGSIFTIALGSLTASDIWGKTEFTDFRELPSRILNFMKISTIFIIISGVISSVALLFWQPDNSSSFTPFIVNVAIPINIGLSTSIIAQVAIDGLKVMFTLAYIFIIMPLIIFVHFFIYLFRLIRSLGIFVFSIMIRIIFIIWFGITFPFQKK